ncbi:MAG: hypothetical protein QN168_00750 [Armatimonadota bacterium]|nr:hypothetical protein [Armatimonadota bacterium]
MSDMHRIAKAERGVALVAVILAIFILTVMVAALGIATMGETTLSADQLRGQQALAVAEAGAYRALAELRRRLSVDLDQQIRQPSVNEADVRNMCQMAFDAGLGRQREPVEILTNYAWPASLGASDWVLTAPAVAGQRYTATLLIGGPDPANPTTIRWIQMTDPSPTDPRWGGIGEYYAIVHVRWSGRASTCQYGANIPEQEVMWYDYAVTAVGRTRNATRTVCLRSPFAARCPDWDWTWPYDTWTTWSGSHALTSGSYPGWPILIEKASYSQWALMLLDVGSVWLFTGTTISGPVHANNRIRIAGNPVLNDVVTQVDPAIQFYNCGNFNTIPIPTSNWNTVLENPGCDDPYFASTVTGGVSSIPLPTNANPSRTSIGLSASGPNATDTEVADRTTDLADGLTSIPDGIYIMDQCGTPACGGVYIKGDVTQMRLSSENGRQVIKVTVPTDPNPQRRNMKIIIDPASRAVTTCWNVTGSDPGNGDCAGWQFTRSYGPGIFNGIVYVRGSVRSAPPGATTCASCGLYGMVNQSTRLTIAAEGEIRITDHLVYEAPPAGPGHNPTNVLGLYAVNSAGAAPDPSTDYYPGYVTIDGRFTPDTLYIDAAVLSPTGQFWVRGWDTLTPPRGPVKHLGGTVQGRFGPFGGFDPTTRTHQTGYAREMTYDWRLRSNIAPPFFPLTEIYTAVRNLTSPLFSSGDALYDRPQWEEMVGL